MGLRFFIFAFIYPVLASSLCAAARASGTASRLYVPAGYDDNDEIVVVIEGYLNNDCEQIRGARVQPSGRSFLILPQVETHGKNCDKLKVPYDLEVVLNPDESLPASDEYEVRVMGSRGKMLAEPLSIGYAPTRAIEYAPVDEANVGLISGGKMRAVIRGRFQNTCITLDHIPPLTTKNGKTFELLPITKRLTRAPDGKPCAAQERRFTAQVDFDEPVPGRYLLHVRSQSGRSINRIFTNMW